MPLILVARLVDVGFDRPRAQTPHSRPYLSSYYAFAVYDSAIVLQGHRPDENRDFYGELPELGGPDWRVGRLYLLVLVPMPGYPQEDRKVYWTAACYGSREVDRVEAARDILRTARRRRVPP